MTRCVTQKGPVPKRSWIKQNFSWLQIMWTAIAPLTQSYFAITPKKSNEQKLGLVNNSNIQSFYLLHIFCVLIWYTLQGTRLPVDVKTCVVICVSWVPVCLFLYLYEAVYLCLDLLMWLMWTHADPCGPMWTLFSAHNLHLTVHTRALPPTD